MKLVWFCFYNITVHSHLENTLYINFNERFIYKGLYNSQTATKTMKKDFLLHAVTWCLTQSFN